MTAALVSLLLFLTPFLFKDLNSLPDRRFEQLRFFEDEMRITLADKLVGGGWGTFPYWFSQEKMRTEQKKVKLFFSLFSLLGLYSAKKTQIRGKERKKKKNEEEKKGKKKFVWSLKKLLLLFYCCDHCFARGSVPTLNSQVWSLNIRLTLNLLCSERWIDEFCCSKIAKRSVG